MTKNSKIKIVALSFSLIAIFFLNGLNFIGLQPFLTDSSNNDSESESDEIIDKIDQRKFDNIDGLKTANGVESNISFSFNASITEEWNQTFVFNNVNSTKNNILETEWMNLTDTKGAELDFGFLFIDIINLTDRHEILPENLTIMYLSYLNESLQRERIGVVTYPGTNQYHINGSIYANNIKTNDYIYVCYILLFW